MRMIGVFGLVLTLAGTAAAQDTSVVIRKSAGSVSGDTTITISRPGQPDQVIHVNGQLNREMRVTLDRQLAESQRNMSRLQQSAREMQVRDYAIARSNAEVARTMQGVNIAGQRMKLDTVQLRSMERYAEGMALRSNELAQRSMQVFVARPRLGVTVDINPRETDKYGAYVSAVTPGGPAAKAGIKSGDIITRLGGKSLTAPDSVRRGADQSVPGMRLIEMASRLEAGKAVEVEYRRGNDTKKVSITPAELQDEDVIYVEGVPAIASTGAGSSAGGYSGRMTTSYPRGAIAEMPVEGRTFTTYAGPGQSGSFAFKTAFDFGGPLGDLELAPLNEKLGAYFGVNQGVLVIDVPEKDNLGLIPGDVITAVDGRKVTNPNQLMRVLRTYDKNEEFKIQVTRQKHQETVTTKLP